jgi:Tol biopolymer transport system component
MQGLRWMAAPLVALAVGCGTQEPSSEPLTSLRGYLVFERSGNLWAKPVAGGKVVALTDFDAVVARSPAVSQDGLHVAFTDSIPGQDAVDIFLLPIGGSSPQPFLPGGYKYEPSWSPDGTRLAFVAPYVSIYSDGGAILIIAASAQNSTTGDLVPVDALIHASGYRSPRAPAWSPDGLSIAFHVTELTSLRRNVVVVRIADPDGSLAMVDTNATDPTWAPDGDRLAYAKSGNIWVKTIGGEEPHQVTFCSESCGHPAWSPDGEFIAFERTGDIWLVRPDGSELVNFTNTSALTETEPTWGPSAESDGS